MIKKIKATWYISLDVTCPFCEEFQEVKYDERYEWWEEFSVGENKNYINYEHTCSKCNKDFIINDFEY